MVLSGKKKLTEKKIPAWSPGKVPWQDLKRKILINDAGLQT
jgi:hypothetical protein